DDHADKAPVRDANRLQRAELLEVFNRENVESLARNNRANDERNRDRDAEVDGDTRVLDVIENCLPREARSGYGPEIRLLLDTIAQFTHGNARPSLCLYKGG